MHAQIGNRSAEQPPSPEEKTSLDGRRCIARLKIGRLSFVTLVLVISGTLVLSVWLWRLACFNGAVHFLPHRPPAEWIVYPSPPSPNTRRVVDLEADFRRDFLLESAPSNAALSVCAFTRCSVRVNDSPVPLTNILPANWKQPLTADIARLLHSGENKIEVTVSNDSGPPALWLSLRGDGVAIASDASWQVSYAGAVWRQARLAEEPIRFMKGSPFYGGETVMASVRARWPEFLLFALISAGLVVGGSWWFKRVRTFTSPNNSYDGTSPERRVTARGLQEDDLVADVGRPSPGADLSAVNAPDRRSALRCILTDPATACLAGIILLWILLFIHNASLLPRVIGFDAQLHIDYIKYIQERRSLPLADEGMSMYNPPLYYLLAAGALGAFRLTTGDVAGIMLLRYLALGFGIVHLFLVFGSLRLVFPRQSGKQAIGLLLAGFLPAQLYLSHYVTNEVLLGVLVTATLYACLRALQDERLSPGRFAGLGALIGLALLTKFTALLVIPFVMGGIALRLFQNGPRDLRTWFRTAGLTALTCMVVCGWHYARVWMHFGKPLVGAWESVSGHRWWQDPGYRTGAYFLRFGESLANPLFSGHASFADGIYSTLWGDGYGGGPPELAYRAPWNYELMAASYLPALVPTVLILAGAFISLMRFIRRPAAEGLLLNGLAWSFVAAFIYMALKVPCYSQIKAFYGLLILLPVCVFGAAGWEFFTRRRGLLRLGLSVTLGMWALSSFGTFWISATSAPAHALLGRQLQLAGEHEKSVQEFSAALKADPSHLNAKSWLADSLAELGQREAANRLLKQLSEEHPQSAVCQLDLALVLESQGRLAEAAEHTRIAVEAAPEAAFGYRLLASRVMKLEQPDQVLRACREGLRIAPADWELHSLLGMALMQPNANGSPSGPAEPAGPSVAAVLSDPIEESVRHLRLASHLSPNAVGPLKSLAWIFATSPDPRWRSGLEAVQLAERACRLTDDKLPEVVGTLAVAYAEAGRFPEAITTAQRAQTLARALGQEKLAALDEEWIASFRAGQPYREPRPALGK